MPRAAGAGVAPLSESKDSTEILGATAKAADSDLLDGFESSDLLEACPAGMVESDELCIGSHQSGSGFDGYYACLNARTRLPDTAEAGLIAAFLVNQPSPVAEDFWTSDMTSGSTAMIGNLILPSFFNVLERPLTDTPGYRCVGTPGQPETGPAIATEGSGAELRPSG